MTHRFLFLLLSTACIAGSTQVYAAPSVKASCHKNDCNKLKKQVASLNATVAKLLGLVKVLRKEINDLKKRPVQKLTKVGRVLGVYYKQWYYHHEQRFPPVFKETRSPYINNWVPTNKVLIFTKKSNTSDLKITYNDNLRAGGKAGHKGDAGCTFSVFIDRKPCFKPSQIEGSVYVHNARIHNPHRQRSIIGVCRKIGWTKERSHSIKKGRHKVRIYVRNVPGRRNGSCYLGWHSSTLLMVEELEPQKKK